MLIIVDTIVLVVESELVETERRVVRVVGLTVIVDQRVGLLWIAATAAVLVRLVMVDVQVVRTVHGTAVVVVAAVMMMARQRRRIGNRNVYSFFRLTRLLFNQFELTFQSNLKYF